MSRLPLKRPNLNDDEDFTWDTTSSINYILKSAMERNEALQAENAELAERIKELEAERDYLKFRLETYYGLAKFRGFI